jgi:hypothetical protein
VPSKKRRAWLPYVAGLATLVVVNAAFQIGYGTIFLAFAVPALACLFLREWERARGLKPGWKFYGFSAIAVAFGTLFGFIWPLIPIIIYFLWLRRKTNRARSVTSGPMSFASRPPPPNVS